LNIEGLSQTSPQPDYESRCKSIGQENKISDQSILSVDQILVIINEEKSINRLINRFLIQKSIRSIPKMNVK